MKFTAKPLVYRFGFRSVLIWNGFVSCVALIAMAAFAFNVPAILMVSVLLVGGFFRSLQFTCLNSMAYAEVEQSRMSLATSLYSVAQQVSLAAGVAVGAAVIEFQRALRPDHVILASDFVGAFGTVALISFCSLFFYFRLPADAAAEMAQRPQAPPRKPVASI